MFAPWDPCCDPSERGRDLEQAKFLLKRRGRRISLDLVTSICCRRDPGSPDSPAAKDASVTVKVRQVTADVSTAINI